MKSIILLLSVLITVSYSFNLNAHSNLVAYFGQDSANDGSQQMLSYYCNDTTYDVFILSFVDIFFSGETFNGAQLPEVNLANLCQNTFPQYPLLMDCPEMGDAIKYCQSKGKIVTISLGGAVGAYGLSSPSEAQEFASTVWNLFLGGNNSYPRPFGDAILDGIDLDIEGGGGQNYNVFLTTLKSKYFAGASKKYYVSGAPQCPFPDAYLGPGPNTALQTGLFDFVNVQFYNNYCDLSGGQSNYPTWSEWAGNSSSTTKIMIGLPAGAQAAGSGYIPAGQVTNALHPYLNSPNFGGVMIWDVSVAEKNKNGALNYAQLLSQYLKKNAPAPSSEDDYEF
ncbi:chitinase [Heterostelium album PN500]|uniref:chitinase n=1 Tax=Heterostelium pallidum (strain ATCC 26659 / Pp 5 / PN500) TaxID=670386 RepID=D3AVP2_HETP5|nr:chitinase [Heterostelium album PN500]EFA86365.1 chitinase [Heterostelium album PN500]|eukprot:XP_020438470.1 chitinase [Heterostelium album PN500]